MNKSSHGNTNTNLMKERKPKQKTDDEKDYSKEKISNNNSDFYNVIFLLLLYTIQGVPIGVSSVVPLIIQDKVSYSQLSMLSLISIPFSLKLLWAPIVDAVYIKKFGRRKSWIIPLQLICSLLMILYSLRVSTWLGERNDPINLYYLTSFFFILFFLMATQDIAVDGWALTMLSEKNKGLASICNILGQNIGYCVSQLSFLTLNNKKICFYLFKRYVKIMHSIFHNSEYYKMLNDNLKLIYHTFLPFVDMNVFLKFWGVFILLLTILTFFKKETSNNKENENTKIIEEEQEQKNKSQSISNAPKKDGNEFRNAKETYKNLYELLFLPPMKIFIILFLINRLPFASVEVATNFKMLKKGITKEEFAIFNPFFIPISIISPAIIGKIIQNTNPLNVYYYGYMLRYISNIVLSTLLPLTEYMYSNKTHAPQILFYMYYLYIFGAQIFNNLCIDLMTVSSMGFQNVISDPQIGGTYMTFLNTINNMGSHWSTIFLWLLDYTDMTICYGGRCIFIDGFYTQMICSFLIGILINSFVLKCIKKLQNFPIEDWRTYSDSITKKNN
ncbi:acetyl-CoA transporter, putative [Plasmodium chabaudi chabaudi]|uniref:Acetyl-CoA transporter, putative n=1 Tax=Plasmodium chabaudi chabaudi TaxID=31271 RepID=A0A4V0K3N5_PLACU|nr:acetyl-CoA transporter, putative [Plasmodium chabaudi chabaudi]VTZ67536.1 acetyl-CoA transporter, putative [Plasmodium chabaudi chabaudi]|eukprot:XP_016655230.1 acetyl-CoA transporter, putative [Plasmodium chabaudi chabaudi]